jgi:hypothetical protein
MIKKNPILLATTGTMSNYLVLTEKVTIFLGPTDRMV